jgi:hypothetical protein
VLLIVDEFPAIAFGGANAASLFEMVRFHGAGLVVTAQSYAGLGADADRILGAAAGLIVHQCADPERLLLRGGQSLSFQRRISFTERGMGQAVREYAVGEGMLAETETLKVDPDTIKQLDAGACVVIAGGRARHVLISQVRLPAPTQTDGRGADCATPLVEAVERDRWRPPLQSAAESNTATVASDAPGADASATEAAIRE